MRCLSHQEILAALVGKSQSQADTVPVTLAPPRIEAPVDILGEAAEVIEDRRSSASTKFWTYPRTPGMAMASGPWVSRK